MNRADLSEVTEKEYVDFLIKTYNFILPESDFVEDFISKNGVKRGLRFNRYINILRWLHSVDIDDGVLNEMKKIGFSGQVTERENDLDKYENTKFSKGYSSDVITLHRAILILSGINTRLFSSEERCIPLADLVNLSMPLLEELELKISPKEWADLIEKDSCWIKSRNSGKKNNDITIIQNRYTFFNSLVVNLLANSTKYMLVNYREKGAKNLLERGGLTYTVHYDGYEYSLFLSSEKILDYGFKDMKPGWNLYLLYIDNVHSYLGRMPLYKPKNIKIRVKDLHYWNALDNRSYSAKLWVENLKYSQPEERSDIKQSVSSSFVDALNIINAKPFRVNTMMLNFMESLNEGEFELIFGSDQTRNLLTKEAMRTAKYFGDSVLYLEHELDRRGRVVCRTFPLNPQQHKPVRYLFSDGNAINYDEILNLLNEKNFIAAIRKNIEIPVNIAETFNAFGYCEKHYEYVYMVYIEHILKLIQFIEKFSPANTDQEMLEKHGDQALRIAEDYSKPRDILGIVNKWGLNVKKEEYCELLCIIDNIWNIANKRLPLNMVYKDATSSVYQIDTILNANLDPKILHMTGLLPNKIYSNISGIYQSIEENISKKLKDNIEKGIETKVSKFILSRLDRKLVKVIAMPKVYGLKYGGMKEQIEKLISKKELLKNLNEKEIYVFYRILWDEVESSLKSFGIDIKKNITLLNKIYDIVPLMYFLDGRGVPIILDKQDLDKTKRNRRTKALSYKGKDGVLRKIVIKKEVSTFEFIKNKKKTKNGLYVGLVHSGDAAIQHQLFRFWPYDISLIGVHDSNGCTGIFLPILGFCYKYSLIKYIEMVYKLHPIINLFNIYPQLNENQELLDSKNKLIEAIKIFIENNFFEEILGSERIFF